MDSAQESVVGVDLFEPAVNQEVGGIVDERGIFEVALPSALLFLHEDFKQFSSVKGLPGKQSRRGVSDWNEAVVKRLS